MHESQLIAYSERHDDPNGFDAMALDRLRTLGRGRSDYFVARVTSSTADTLSIGGKETILCSYHEKNTSDAFYYGPKPVQSGESDPGDIMISRHHLELK